MIAAFALGGAVFGLLADRLSVRWPAHEADHRPRGFDWRTVVLALAGGVAFGGLASRWSDVTSLAVLAVYCAALLVLLATDLDQKLLPDLITLPLICYSGTMLVVGWSPLLAGKELGLASGIVAGIAAPVFLFVTDRLMHGDLGDGDLKLAVSLGLMSGIAQLIYGLLIATVCFSAVLLGLIALRRIGMRSAVPFGPVLIATGFVAVLIG